MQTLFLRKCLKRFCSTKIFTTPSSFLGNDMRGFSAAILLGILLTIISVTAVFLIVQRNKKPSECCVIDWLLDNDNNFNISGGGNEDGVMNRKEIFR